MTREEVSQTPSTRTEQSIAPARSGRRRWFNRFVADNLSALARGFAPARQRLLTTDGLRPLADIAPGDRVISYDPGQQLSVEREVTHVDALAPEPIWEVRFTDTSPAVWEAHNPVDGDGDGVVSLRATRRHRVLTATGWRRIDRLRPGEFVSSADADGERLRMTVAGVRPTSRREPVYALSVEGGHPLIMGRVVAESGFARGALSRVAWRMRGASLRSVETARR